MLKLIKSVHIDNNLPSSSMALHTDQSPHLIYGLITYCVQCNNGRLDFRLFPAQDALLKSFI